MTIFDLKAIFILRGSKVNWYVIFVNKNKINDLLICFNKQPGMKAFVPKIERWMKKDGEKKFYEVDMFPSYIFIETTMSEQEFYDVVDDLEKDLGSMMKILQSDTQTVLALTNDEKVLLESLLNDQHLIMHSTGIIINSKLVIQEGPLRGKEELIRKVDRHKKLAFLDNVFGKIMKVPLEVTSKS